MFLKLIIQMEFIIGVTIIAIIIIIQNLKVTITAIIIRI